MKSILLHNWQAKVISFFLAVILWLALKELQTPGTIDQIFTGTTMP
jgi:YbbR domain-containing protein